MKKILIDPGHGGADVGAVGIDGATEAEEVMETALRLADLVSDHPQLTPKLTRHGGQFKDLAERSALANAEGSDLFVSIHCNASQAHQANGFEIFTSPGKTKSDKAATKIFNRWNETFGRIQKMRVGLEDGDPDKEARFHVLTKTRGPAVLIECEFIDNEWGTSFIRANHDQMATAIYRGILDYFGLEYFPARPYRPAVDPERTISTPEELAERIVAIAPDEREPPLPRYSMVCEADHGLFEQLCDEALAGRWKLHGGVVVSPSSNGQPVYYQAFIREG